MSYILEALKKAEHEREIGQVPRIDSEHEPASARVSSRWVMLVVLVLLVNAGLLTALFWPDGSTEEMEPVAGAPPATLPDIDNPAAVPEVTDEAVILPERREAVAERTTPVTRPTSASPPSAVEVPAETVMQRSPTVVPSVAPLPPVAAVPSPPEPAPVVPQQTENLPVWPQVPEFIFRRLSGGLRLDVLVYSDLPRDRFVLVNLQKYREGEQLQEGPLLDAITPDGIVLSLQGQKFLVRAQ